MSTNATIAIATDTGYENIYLHWDGGQRAHDMLVENYNTQEKVEALIALGNVSNLEASIECPEGHDFDNRVEGYTTFYHRDRKEDWVRTKPQKHIDIRLVDKQNFNYLWHDGEWVTF